MLLLMKYTQTNSISAIECMQKRWKLQIGRFAEASNFGKDNVYAKTPKLYTLEAWLTHDPERY